jgi:hypothetical protein
LGKLVGGNITLVASDGGYGPIVRQLMPDGFKVTLLYCYHAGRELQALASRFYPLGAYSTTSPRAEAPHLSPVSGDKAVDYRVTGRAGQGRGSVT